MSLIGKAATFAAQKHLGQKRKYTGEPYSNHCHNVFVYTSKFTSNENILAAAFLHDTLEDTDTAWVELENTFNTKVADIVLELTDGYTKEAYQNLNRKERKFLEACRLRDISQEAKLIKYFDIMDNSSTIFKYDPEFAKTYLKEKQFILSYALDDLSFANFLLKKEK